MKEQFKKIIDKFNDQNSYKTYSNLLRERNIRNELIQVACVAALTWLAFSGVKMLSQTYFTDTSVKAERLDQLESIIVKAGESSNSENITLKVIKDKTIIKEYLQKLNSDAYKHVEVNGWNDIALVTSSQDLFDNKTFSTILSKQGVKLLLVNPTTNINSSVQSNEADINFYIVQFAQGSK
jgi:uncharacterized protein YaaR (DUF327 family)